MPETAAFKRLATPILGKMLQPSQASPDETLAPYLKAGHVTWQGLKLPEELPEMWVRPADIAGIHPNAGDLLICEGGEVGRACLATNAISKNTIVQNSLHVVRATERADPRYLKYSLEHVASSGWLDIVCNKATIAHLTVEKLRELKVPFQSLAAQEGIANFLDDKTARIDALIAEKERLSATLANTRNAIAFHLITGSHGNSERVLIREEPWFSEVPENWSLPKLGYLADVGNGSTPRREIEEYWVNGTIPWVTSTAIHDGNIEGSRELVTELAQKECSIRIVRPGSTIVGLIGQGPTRGMAARLTIPATVSQNVAYVTRKEEAAISDEYLTLALSGMYTVLRFLSDGSGGAQGAMNCEQLRSLRIPLPPPAIQAVAVKEFAIKEAAFSSLIAHVDEHIARLREYRSSLISAAVTGQLDIGDFKETA